MPSIKQSLTRILGAGAALLCLCAVVLYAGCGSSKDSTPPKTTYSGTLYMASEAGGHVAVVPVTIDPSATPPIKVGSLSRVQLSTTAPANNVTHIFHDLRLDGSKLYYSAIYSDMTGCTTTNGTTGCSNPGMVHLGYVDLASGNAVHDATIDAAAQATAPPTMTNMAYCGSGQSATHFFPMTMSSPAYIDAIAKSAITTGATLSSSGANVKRTMIESFRASANPNYLFAHGVDNPNHTKLYVAVNETSSGAMTGAITSYLVNTSDLVAGTASSSNVTSKTNSGFSANMGTIAFRSTFTPDGTKILQSGKDRIIVLNASDLSVLDNNTVIGGSFAANTANGGIENHDAMPTPDGKYAILSLRFQHTNSEQQDSGVQLYDLANKKAVGDPVSVCGVCHSPASIARHTCAVEGSLTAVTQ